MDTRTEQEKAAAAQRLLRAAQKPETLRTIASAVRSFERGFGGLLPCTGPVLEDYATWARDIKGHNPRTIKKNVYLLRSWHQRQGFEKPTMSHRLEQLFQGMREEHNPAPKQARPLDTRLLQTLVAHLAETLRDSVARAEGAPDNKRLQNIERGRQRRAIRDKSLILLAFWTGFRSANLIGLQREHLQFGDAEAGGDRTLKIYLPKEKGDRKRAGAHKELPELDWLCPVAALQDWLAAGAIKEGFVYTEVKHWSGEVSDRQLSARGVNTILKRIFTEAEIDGSGYSAHSFRHGLVNYIADQGGQLADAVQIVGWRDFRSALTYQRFNSNKLKQFNQRGQARAQGLQQRRE